ncbi:SPOR domain-containing protein [Sphingomonas arenae]|uniref:SPOR domain-containing protein n=1 Tax=Sphingomonas arenae TaxID=2812555 RepID=UPI00196881A2|nr:SPOR domain-containing protein [Sphingomonas arenae]
MRLWIGAALLLAAAPVAGQDVQAGIRQWQAGDAESAVAIWKPLASRGDADAQYNLGQAYRLGRGVPADLAQAQSLYERAARQGHIDAQTSLGLLLFQNGNRTTALQWLKSAADTGEPRALLIYGTALFNGDGVQRDVVTAYAMVSRAAAQGLEPAKATLGEMDQIIPLAQRRAGVAKALAWTKANPKRPPQTASVKAPAATSPKPIPRAAADTITATALAGGWRIQLGAFSNRASAEALFARLRNLGPLTGKQPTLVPSGAMTRLQVGPYLNRTEAASACKALAARGQACFPVPAR